MRRLILLLAALCLSTHVAATDCGKISNLPADILDYWAAPSIETFSEIASDDVKKASDVLGARRIAEISPRLYKLLTKKKLHLKHGYIVQSARFKNYDGEYVLRRRDYNLFIYYGGMGVPDECEYFPLIVESDLPVREVYYGVGAAK